MIKKKSITKVHTKTNTQFPTRELNSWLKEHKFWSHDEWLNLLNDLRDKGFTQWTDSQDGCNQLGMYLEENRA